ncbi:lytic transglycosylase domain-containing protein [Aminipila sp.]|uniref:lytic transglycosylase domain-containing protein n=1 Tax=Aminipila sp. TaxID=2060095 RepID=UPI0028973CC7|nr:lytic transglycosylase domain-containing protein [Aminipila sp.]
MSIDRIKQINQYVQGINQGTIAVGSANGENNNFEQALSKIISQNQSLKSFSNVINLTDNKNATTTNDQLDKIFTKAAETYDVPLELLKAVAKAESGFNPNAVSKCGAMGIMQLMPATAKALGVVDAYDPEQNIMGGASYLSQKLKAYDGDMTLALAAYNAGSGNVAKYGGVPPFKETQNYIKKIFGYMGQDIELPAQVTRTADTYDSGLTKGISGSEMDWNTENDKAYFAARLQILRHQLDMQQLFATGDLSEEQDNDYDTELNGLLNTLKYL